MRILHLPVGDPLAALDALSPLGPVDAELDAIGLRVLLAESPTLEAEVRAALGLVDPAPLRWSAPVWRDAASVAWIVPRPRRVGPVWVAPPGDGAPPPGTVWLADGEAFGTGAHPTTALCAEALAEVMEAAGPAPSVLDVGTGSGVLALVALQLGARRVVGVDTDAAALAEAAHNVALNGETARVELVVGGPEDRGRFPVVVANILAAPLQVLAAAIADTVAHDGELVLGGIPVGVEAEVVRAYVRRGMRPGPVTTRGGWSCLRLRAGW